MVYEDGDVEVVATSQRPIPLRIIDEHGENGDLTGATSAQLRLQNINDTSDLITFKTTDSPQKFFLPEDLTTGLCTLNPAIDDFIEPKTYRYQIWGFGLNGKFSYPDDKKKTVYEWKVVAEVPEEGAES